MPKFQVTIFVSPDHVNSVLGQMMQAVGIDALGEFLEDRIDPWLRSRIKNRFAQEGDDVTGPWKPLRPATNAIRLAKGYSPGHPINVRDAIMKRFLVGTPGDVRLSGVEASLTHPGPTSDALTQQKINTAQRGKTYPRTEPRPVMGVNQNDLMFIQNELVQHIFGGIK